MNEFLLDQGNLERVATILNTLRGKGESLSVAESLTGGLLGGAITSVAGASDVFVGGITAYTAEQKIALLGVEREVIATHGVVSAQVAAAMSRGAQKVFGSQWAISTTGVAGPGPSEGVPAGRVWIAVAGPGIAPITQEFALAGERQSVRLATITCALEAFARILSL